MGPSGCGKTTLLSAIANRLHAPARMSGGDIFLNNERCNTKEGGLPLDVLGFVPQEDIMLRELTVRQVLWYSLLLKGNPKRTWFSLCHVYNLYNCHSVVSLTCNNNTRTL